MSPKVNRDNVLPTDHLRGPKPLRSDYTEFMGPTAQARRWARNMREMRGNKR